VDDALLCRGSRILGGIGKQKGAGRKRIGEHRFLVAVTIYVRCFEADRDALEEVAWHEIAWCADALAAIRDVEPLAAPKVLLLPLIRDGAVNTVGVGQRTCCREGVPDGRDAGRIAWIRIVNRQ